MTLTFLPFAGARRPARRPDPPGPGPMPESVLRSLDLIVRRRMDGLFAGDVRSSRISEGTELEQIRPYRPGDDVRQIDWSATARTREPHIRVHVAERAVVTWLVLDASPSMGFGTALRRKTDVATGTALALAHVATRHGNRLGIVAFGGPSARLLPPRLGRAGLLGLLQALNVDLEPGQQDRRSESLGEALGRTGLILRTGHGRRALIAVISDFRGSRDWRRPLTDLAARHEVIAVEVGDPREQELPDVGDLWLVDPESGRRLRVDTGRRRLRERFAAAAAAERAEVRADIRASGAEHVVLSTASDWLRDLARALALREARR